MLNVDDKSIQNSINNLIDYSIERGYGKYIKKNKYTAFVTLWTDKDFQVELRIGLKNNRIVKFIMKNGEAISQIFAKVNLND